MIFYHLFHFLVEIETVENRNCFISSIPCLASVYLVCCASHYFCWPKPFAHCWPSILLFWSLLSFWCLSWCVRLLCLESGAWNVDGLFGVPVSPQYVQDSETFWHNSCPKLSPNNLKTFTVSILYLKLCYFAYIRDTSLTWLTCFYGTLASSSAVRRWYVAFPYLEQCSSSY